MATTAATAKSKPKASSISVKPAAKAPTRRTSSVTSTDAAPATAPAKAKQAAPRKKAPTKVEAAKRANGGKPAVIQTGDSSREQQGHADRAWELAKKIGTCMFVTWDGERQRARPLAAHVDKDAGEIWFLTDVAGQKDDQVEKFPTVTLAFADTSHSRYVSITGKATVHDDRKRIAELWSPFAKAWWDSPDDPSIRALRVVPEDAELWDSPGRIASTVAMLAAAVTRKPPKLGENAKVVL